MLTNCVNCVAPIDPKLDKCPYCGTSYEAMGVHVDTGHKDILYADNAPVIEINVAESALAIGAISVNDMRRIMGLKPVHW